MATNVTTVGTWHRRRSKEARCIEFGLYCVNLIKIRWKLWKEETNEFGPLVTTNGTVRCQKLISIYTLVLCMFCMNMKKTQVSRLHTRKTNLPPSGHMWNHRVPKINWCLDLGTRDIWHEFVKDWMRTVGCRVHTTNLFGGSCITITKA